MFYALLIDGEITYVIRWDRGSEPTLFDFGCPYSSWLTYEVREVDVVLLD